MTNNEVRQKIKMVVESCENISQLSTAEVFIEMLMEKNFLPHYQPTPFNHRPTSIFKETVEWIEKLVSDKKVDLSKAYE